MHKYHIHYTSCCIEYTIEHTPKIWTFSQNLLISKRLQNLPHVTFTETKISSFHFLKLYFPPLRNALVYTGHSLAWNEKAKGKNLVLVFAYDKVLKLFDGQKTLWKCPYFGESVLYCIKSNLWNFDFCMLRNST